MLLESLFWISVAMIIWSMIGYPIVLKVLRVFINRKNEKQDNVFPPVTIMVVAHNEEKVIKEKLNNIISVDYPRDKIKFIITSDKSTDATNKIVDCFIKAHPEYDIQLYITKEHKGKTNAQNEAQKLVDSEILVMTDANAMIHVNAIKELASSFNNSDIVYVSGRLVYVNNVTNQTVHNENTYWNLDLEMREIESNIKTITAGNGALYACRNSAYFDADPIRCHDSVMPYYYGLQNKRCLFNKNAIATEKAGGTDADEFKRKVRMNRGILKWICPSFDVFNVFRYGWFSFFYFGHRSCRYSLWLFHILALICNVILVWKSRSPLYVWTISIQIAFLSITWIGMNRSWKNRFLSLIAYYGMTIFAQFIGVINCLTGKAKPVWDKAETTR